MSEKYNIRGGHGRGGIALARLSACLWPALCAVCHRPGQSGLDLCAACLASLPRLAEPGAASCPRCGERLGMTNAAGTGVPPADAPPGDDAGPCLPCAARRSPFERLVVPWRYDFPLDALIRRMKYRDERVLARVFGTALAREALLPPGQAAPDVLLGMPSRAERRERGFDHAAALARWCAREARLPDVSRLARRVVDTGPLAGLSRAERADRIRGAFRVDDAVAGRRIAIVDDVLTSGASAGELARELYDTGAAAVELWVLARTPAGR